MLPNNLLNPSTAYTNMTKQLPIAKPAYSELAQASLHSKPYIVLYRHVLYPSLPVRILSNLPVDAKVSWVSLAINTGFRSEIGLAVIIFPPRDWRQVYKIYKLANRWKMKVLLLY